MSENSNDKLALAMDSTAVIDFTRVDNTKYSQEIIDGARASYDPDKLEALKAQTDLTPFYAEGKKQIVSQLHADQALAIHCDMSRVQFLIHVGTILNVIELTFLAGKTGNGELTGEDDHLFVGQRGAWTAQAIQQIVKKYLKKLGIYEKGKSVHALRHSYAVELYSKERDLRAVQKTASACQHSINTGLCRCHG
jgi:integrase